MTRQTVTFHLSSKGNYSYTINLSSLPNKDDTSNFSANQPYPRLFRVNGREYKGSRPGGLSEWEYVHIFGTNGYYTE